MAVSEQRETITKTLKFVIQSAKEHEPFLKRLTARWTYGVKRYLEIIEKEQTTNKRILDKLTITTAKRPKVRYDLKKEMMMQSATRKRHKTAKQQQSKTKQQKRIGLGAVFLQQCRDTAIWMRKSYESNHNKWKRRRNSATEKTMLKILANIELDWKGRIIKKSTLEDALETFSKTQLWRRLKRNEPKPPLESHAYEPKKLPIQLDSRSVTFLEKDKQFILPLSTLYPHQKIFLPLAHGAYQLRELAAGTITGGKIVRNYEKDRWEFHASLTKDCGSNAAAVGEGRKKRVILGVDLGICVDATVIALREGEKLTKDCFHFLKEGALRKKKFELDQTCRKHQQAIAFHRAAGRSGTADKLLEELQNSKHKRKKLTNEACHKIAKRVALLARKYLKKGYEVHIAIGKLKGLSKQARKGDGKGKKFRGRISRFPYRKLTQYIIYKCLEIGVPKENIAEINERWTSKRCHKCGSTNTSRPSQGQFICNDCGCQYNADANGAINIALRYWMIRACHRCQSLQTSSKKGGSGELKGELLISCPACGLKCPAKENTAKNKKILQAYYYKKNKEAQHQKCLVNDQGHRGSIVTRPTAMNRLPREETSGGHPQTTAGNSASEKAEEAGTPELFNFVKRESLVL